MHYDRFTRLLHILLALGITVQMAVSLGMTHPKPGRAGDILYDVHELLGAALLGVLVLHWLWSMTRSGQVGIGRLFPWFSITRINDLKTDIGRYRKALGHGRLPESDESSALAGAFEGLGLIVGTALAVSGTLILVYAVEGQRMTGWLHDIKEIHEILGPLMWGYLGVHAAAGFAHQLSGHGSLSAMMSIWRRT
ncbi:cytochrome b/b6 domain-containing protein [Magnetovibrio blakemorei]|uniref:Cytochrome b561 bacterial/Ni-hydrogenase domain-containing protein n=1 Tax=Magnetovibrio blakemorei TaxID=28181 RepID=A0A1E5Q8K8_9PROT|nr:cytochrome b/b6 domain-containing protein [Magnetovibrio blakemorei]OEJ67727.1 hypothetical protein BEN30_08320 [Magnetovibrio blakemorei]